ncbi:MAG: hypothetical protein KAS32_04205 [Candidatus Peribacteraceae bacterium]|nr:hypothetical protein [Candidatus Peribacteraceae bacterium]
MTPMPDTTGVETKEFPPIKPGWYEVTLKEFEEKRGKSGYDYAKLTFEFAEGNRKAWENLSYHPDALFRVKAFKQVIGAKDTDTNLGDFIGTRLMAFCKNEQYEGKNQIAITEFKPYSDGNTPVMPKDVDDMPF